MQRFDILVAGTPEVVLEVLQTSLGRVEGDRFVMGVGDVPGYTGRYRVAAQVEGTLTPVDGGVRVIGVCGADPSHTWSNRIAMGLVGLVSIAMATKSMGTGSLLDAARALLGAATAAGVGIGFLYFLSERASAAADSHAHARLLAELRGVRAILEVHDAGRAAGAPVVPVTAAVESGGKTFR